MLTSLTIQNFKCFESVTLTLAPLTILTGLNGSGKSTVLQSLLLLRQSHMSGFLARGSLQLNGEYVQIGAADDALYQWAESQNIAFTMTSEEDEKKTEIQWEFSYGGVDGQSLDIIASKERIPTTSGYKQLGSLFQDNFQYLSAERLGPRISFALSEHQVKEKKQLGARGEYTAHFLSLFGDESVHTSIQHPRAKSKKLRDQVEAWLSEICPGTRLKTTLYREIDQAGLRYSFAGRSANSDDFRASNVGFGISYTLPILTAILSAPQGTLLILENPEAHLHPKGQRQLGYLLGLASAYGIQIIMETHSEQILSGVRLALFAERLVKKDVSLCYFSRQEQGKLFVGQMTPKDPTRAHLIDEGPHNAFEQWELEEAQERAALIQESLLWGDEKIYKTLTPLPNREEWSPEEYIQYIKELLLLGSHKHAKEIAMEGAEKHPDNKELQERVAFFTPAPATVQEPQDAEGLKKNRDWLRTHRNDYKKKWVALQNGTLVAEADSLRDLAEQVGELRTYFVTEVR